jgi:hypothetical protein
MIIHVTRLAILRGCVDTPPRSQPDGPLSTLDYEPKPSCNISRLPHGHMPISCAHTIGYINNPLSEVRIETYVGLSKPKSVNRVAIPTQKYTSILMLPKCILMHPTGILV